MSCRCHHHESARKGNPSSAPQVEVKMREILAAHFRAQGKAVAEGLEVIAHKLEKNPGAAILQSGDSKRLVEECTPLLQGVLGAGMKAALGKIHRLPRTADGKGFAGTASRVEVRVKEGGKLPRAVKAPSGKNDFVIEIADLLKDPEVVKAAEEEMYAFAHQIDQTTADALREQITSGLERGLNINEIANGVSTLTDEWAEGWRSEMIARTETARAFTLGHLTAWKATGAVKRKVWLASSDACPFCQEISGTAVPLDEPFFKLGDSQEAEWNGQTILMDHDYSDVMGPPLHPNCRCDIIAEFDEESLQMPEEEEDQPVPLKSVNSFLKGYNSDPSRRSNPLSPVEPSLRILAKAYAETISDFSSLGEIREMRLVDLRTGQPSVRMKELGYFMAGGKAQTDPVVFEVKGFEEPFYLWDGNHRAAAAWIKGCETLRVRVIEVPEHQKEKET